MVRGFPARHLRPIMAIGSWHLNDSKHGIYTNQGIMRVNNMCSEGVEENAKAVVVVSKFWTFTWTEITSRGSGRGHELETVREVR